MTMLAHSSVRQHTTILTWFRTKVGFVEVACENLTNNMLRSFGFCMYSKSSLEHLKRKQATYDFRPHGWGSRICKAEGSAFKSSRERNL